MFEQNKKIASFLALFSGINISFYNPINIGFGIFLGIIAIILAMPDNKK